MVTSLLYYNIEEETKKEYAMPTEYEKMIAGDFYKPSDPELRALAASSREKQWAFNAEPDRHYSSYGTFCVHSKSSIISTVVLTTTEIITPKKISSCIVHLGFFVDCFLSKIRCLKTISEHF